MEQSVRDALRQVDVDIEVLIVDDGSRDADAVHGIETLDSRIRVIRHDRPGGVARARNTGVANAYGTWSAFLDDDDRWAPTKLRTQLAAAGAAQASWVYCAALTIDQEDRPLFVHRAGRPSSRDWLGIVNPIPGGCSNVVARTELLHAVGGFDERLAFLADWDLWVRLAAKAAPAVSDEVLVAYRLHPGNMSVRKVEEVDVDLDYLGRKHLPGRDSRRNRPRPRWRGGQGLTAGPVAGAVRPVCSCGAGGSRVKPATWRKRWCRSSVTRASGPSGDVGRSGRCRIRNGSIPVIRCSATTCPKMKTSAASWTSSSTRGGQVQSRIVSRARRGRWPRMRLTAR